MDGWSTFVQDIYSVWNSSPMGKKNAADFRNFFLKTLAMTTDHANDQKKLKKLFEETKRFYDREVCGEAALKAASPEDLLFAIFAVTEAKITAAGGQVAWDALPPAEQSRRNTMLERDVCQKFGEDAFNSLTEEQQCEASFFLWAGCCMHKDLNCHKSGNARLMQYWSKNGLTGPILLMNKQNAEHAAIGEPESTKHAEESSTCGAVKLTSLMGSLLNHKDKKKGVQNPHPIFFESMLGFRLRFPDTSNTRYQSHADASAEIVIHFPLYIQLLAITRNRKDTRVFMNIELNIWNGLHDIPTITEICVLALYGQAIPHPYMRVVRGHHDDPEASNLLNQGPLHNRVKLHCRLLIEHPEYLYGPEASYEQGALDGKPWERPEAVYAVQALAVSLPHLRGALVKFIEGALEGWVRFSAEFDMGGAISDSTSEQRRRAWMPSTNDANEGGLGTIRLKFKDSPNISLDVHNRRQMYCSDTTYSSCHASQDPLKRRDLGFVTRPLIY